MNDGKSKGRTPLAGGFFIAILALIGVFAGGFMGQPTIGLLAGLAAGGAISFLIWWIDRRQ